MPATRRVEVRPKYMSRKEAGTYFGVTEKTIDRWAAAGLLDVVRLGPRIVRITMQSVRELEAGER